MAEPSAPGQDLGPFLGEFPAASALPASPRPLSGPLLVWSRRRALPAPSRLPLPFVPLPPGCRRLGTGTQSPWTRCPGGHPRRGAQAPASARLGHGGPPPVSRDLRLGLGPGVLRPAEEVRPGSGPEAQSESFPARGQRGSPGRRGPARTDGPGGRDPPAAPGRYAGRAGGLDPGGRRARGSGFGNLERLPRRGLGAATPSRADVLTSSWSSWLGARAPGTDPRPSPGGWEAGMWGMNLPLRVCFPKCNGSCTTPAPSPWPVLTQSSQGILRRPPFLPAFPGPPRAFLG